VRPGGAATGLPEEVAGVAIGVRPGQRRALAVLVVLMMAVSTGSAVALTAPRFIAPPVAVPPEPVPLLGPLASDAPQPTAAGVAAALDPLASSAALGRLTGTVLDPASGAVLWNRGAERGTVPGSTAKLLTAAAALLTLDPTERLATRVQPGDQPGTIVLVGGGDPTLTALPAGREGVYPEPSRLADLAEKVKASGTKVERIVVDASRYSGGGLAEGWSPGDVAGGYVTPIEALMIDGGRIDPALQDGPRVQDPALTAGRAFARLLGVDERNVTAGTAPTDVRGIGSVFSAPVAELVEHAIRTSDNVLAETLAREVALAREGDTSFVGAADEVTGALNQAGFDTSGLVLVDGSGLSTRDRVPARLLGAVLAAAAVPAQSRRDTLFLRPLLTGLPVAGGDGTLDDRFTGTGRGVVRAKTGTLTGVSSLAGVVTDGDGRLLVFAFMSTGTSPAVARPGLDRLAASLSGCGCR
jgi:D-alanyl-D-alanine carboxypeptidase/D-alanyl-D-alanine-endopeptidase (penicillin-binding protein 4)